MSGTNPLDAPRARIVSVEVESLDCEVCDETLCDLETNGSGVNRVILEVDLPALGMTTSFPMICCDSCAESVREQGTAALVEEARRDEEAVRADLEKGRTDG